MENDIISNTLINESTAEIISKLYRLSFVFIILNITYSIFDLIDWYSILSSLNNIARNGSHFIYRYKVRPIIVIFLLSTQIMTSILAYNGYGFILNGIKNKDSSSLQKGFKNFYTSSVLAIISFSISIVSLIYRLYTTW